jgi:predicted transcriptional regulator
MTHSIHKIKISQEFKKNTAIPGSGFYKIGKTQSSKVITLYQWTHTLADHPSGKTDSKKASGRIIM